MSTATSRPTLTILAGSTREGRFGPTLVRWVADRARLHDAFDVRIVDPADFDLPLAHPADPRAVAGDFLDALDADAVVVVTPEYNHSFPGILKVALDLVGGELVDTPVGIVSYGGMSSGLRATEALRNVLSALRAIAITDTVGFAGPWNRFVDGELVDGAAASEEAMDRVLDELARFASAFARDRGAAEDQVEVEVAAA